MVRFSRLFRRMPAEVSEELRGWMWSDYPLVSSFSVRLGVSDVAGGFCSSGRFVYLKYVLKVKGEVSWRVEAGSFIHRVYSEAVRNVKSILYSCDDLESCNLHEEFEARRLKVKNMLLNNLKVLNREVAARIFDRLWDYARDTYSSTLQKVKTISPYLNVDGAVSLITPLITEYPVDGTLIGLTKAIRVDALLPPSTIVEIKTRELKPEYKVGLAAYALAFESQYEIPVNYAVLVNVRFNKDYTSFKVYEKPVLISDSLRQEFIDKRDQLARIVEEELDPGKPEKCDPECPYIKYCRGEV